MARVASRPGHVHEAVYRDMRSRLSEIQTRNYLKSLIDAGEYPEMKRLDDGLWAELRFYKLDKYYMKKYGYDSETLRNDVSIYPTRPLPQVPQRLGRWPQLPVEELPARSVVRKPAAKADEPKVMKPSALPRPIAPALPPKMPEFRVPRRPVPPVPKPKAPPKPLPPLPKRLRRRPKRLQDYA